MATRIPTAAELHRQATLEAFSTKLVELLKKHKMTEAELARKIFGEKPTARGGTEAIGRDRINLYTHGKQLPSPDVAARLSAVLGFDFDSILSTDTEDIKPLDYTIIRLPWPDNRQLLRMSAAAPSDVIARLIDLVEAMFKKANLPH